MIQKRNVTKIFALTITLGILVTLIISAPAQAYILRLDSSSNKVAKGDIVTFTATVQIEPEDRANITSLQFKLAGPLDIICKFKPNGEIIEGCDGITIKKVSKCSNYQGYVGYPNCEYGYYGDDQEITYNITYNTSSNFAGSYKSSLVVFSGNNPISRIDGEILNVTALVNPNKKFCSIRAKNGGAFINDVDFGSKNNLNFYIQQPGARPGEGYITGQKGRTTFSYKFVVRDLLERDGNHTAVSVIGKYKTGIGPEVEEKSVILLNKVNKRLDVIGEDVVIEYMDVSFQDGNC